MQRKVIILFICFLGILSFSGCEREKMSIRNGNQIERCKKILKESVSMESLNGKTFPANYSKDQSQLSAMTGIVGNISNILYDIDHKGTYRGFQFDFSEESISTTFLDFQDNDIKKLDEQFLLEQMPLLDQFHIILFAIELNSQPYFFLEINGSSSILADGKYFELRYVTVQGDHFVVGPSVTYETGVLVSKEVSDYINKVTKMGLSMSTIDQTIFSQNKKAVQIFEIERTHLEKFKKQDDLIQYGETVFKDYFFNNAELKLENVKTKIDSDSINFEFDVSNLGIYTWVNSESESTMSFELGKGKDHYYYVLEFYPNGSVQASEELWGTWDVTKREFIPNNDNTNSLAEYKIKNVKYHHDRISFEIELREVLNSSYQDAVIPDGTYDFVKHS